MYFQIMNRGLIQFVDNSTGDYFEGTLTALKEMGLPRHSKILENIKQKFSDQNIPKDMEERRNLIDSINENLNEEG